MALVVGWVPLPCSSPNTFGAEVTAMCGPGNAELVRSLGADYVIDYTKEDITQSSRKFDLVLGINGSQPLRVYKGLLAPKGIFVMVGGALSQVLKTMVFGPGSCHLEARRCACWKAKPPERPGFCYPAG
jgi:NADPH:quinone reductase-like Zn-dependent oxidoreductase